MCYRFIENAQLKINYQNTVIKSIHSIDTGYFKLDGGAMFGVVPKSIWNKLNPADENNMCSWALRCLLICTNDGKNILVDTGIGNKQDEKFKSHFYLHGSGDLIQSIKALGLEAEDITDVILTHLHFDHCGGAVRKNEDNELIPTFPNAIYWSTQTHWNWASNPNEREKNSFLKENFQPLQDHDKLKFIIESSDRVDFMEGISIHFCSGHTQSLMAIEMDCNGQNYLFTADLFPSSYHVPIAYVMAYDIFPMLSLLEKKKMLNYAIEKNSIMIFEHDPNHIACNFKKNEQGRIVVNEYFNL
ncbi:MAG: MBL fold metallo-hydrolase [Saprospiraceae bacterium]